MCWRRLPVYVYELMTAVLPQGFFFLFSNCLLSCRRFSLASCRNGGCFFPIGPSSLTSPQDSAWRNSSCFSVCLKKRKVYSDSKQEGEVLWPIFTLLSFILPKWPHRGRQARKAINSASLEMSFPSTHQLHCSGCSSSPLRILREGILWKTQVTQLCELPLNGITLLYQKLQSVFALEMIKSWENVAQ